MNDVLQTIANRISLRVYKDQPIDEADKNAIIQAAMRAPTAGNQMLYSMIVIKDQAKKERLSELCDHQAFITKAPLAIVFVADPMCHNNSSLSDPTPNNKPAGYWIPVAFTK